MGLLMGPLGDIIYDKVKNKTRQGILGAINVMYQGQNNAIKMANERKEAERDENTRTMNKASSNKNHYEIIPANKIIDDSEVQQSINENGKKASLMTDE